MHNYGNFNYKYMYFLKKCIFFENFYLITGKNNKEKTTKLNNKLHPSVSILCCITSSLDDSFNATSIVSCCVSVVDIHGELPHSNKS